MTPTALCLSNLVHEKRPAFRWVWSVELEKNVKEPLVVPCRVCEEVVAFVLNSASEEAA